MIVHEKVINNDSKKPEILNTAINVNYLDSTDKFIYRPVGFKGKIEMIGNSIVRVKGQAVFDGFFYGDYGTLFLEVFLGDQVMSMIPVDMIEVKSSDWSHPKTDFLWAFNLDLLFDVEDSKVFNANANDKILFGFKIQLHPEIWQNNAGVFILKKFILILLEKLMLMFIKHIFNLSIHTKLLTIVKLNCIKVSKLMLLTSQVN